MQRKTITYAIGEQVLVTLLGLLYMLVGYLTSGTGQALNRTLGIIAFISACVFVLFWTAMTVSELYSGRGKACYWWKTRLGMLFFFAFVVLSFLYLLPVQLWFSGIAVISFIVNWAMCLKEEKIDDGEKLSFTTAFKTELKQTLVTLIAFVLFLGSSVGFFLRWNLFYFYGSITTDNVTIARFLTIMTGVDNDENRTYDLIGIGKDEAYAELTKVFRTEKKCTEVPLVNEHDEKVEFKLVMNDTVLSSVRFVIYPKQRLALTYEVEDGKTRVHFFRY